MAIEEACSRLPLERQMNLRWNLADLSGKLSPTQTQPHTRGNKCQQRTQKGPFLGGTYGRQGEGHVSHG